MKSKEFFRLHAEICRSISHPKRLEILSLLGSSERSVTELAELMGISPANVSQQLGVLRNSGVVERRMEGTSAFYRIANMKILKAYDLMTEVMEEKIAGGLKALEEKPSE
jgi:ArsR family transcriptional regulator